VQLFCFRRALSGSHLLYLLAEHAGIEARIEPPEDWVDPAADMVTGEPSVDAVVGLVGAGEGATTPVA
jgi:hypothetical protein